MIPRVFLNQYITLPLFVAKGSSHNNFVLLYYYRHPEEVAADLLRHIDEPDPDTHAAI